MVTVYTGHYRYAGPDRLDITVKGQDPIGRVFAPTWSMVTLLKKGVMTQENYTAQYHRRMRESWKENKGIWQKVWDMDVVTFVCFCPSGAFCHRYLLADMFQRMGATYMGGRT